MLTSKVKKSVKDKLPPLPYKNTIYKNYLYKEKLKTWCITYLYILLRFS